MKRFLIACVLAALPSAASAYQVTLPQGVVVCGTLRSLKEAERAVAADDFEHFRQLPDCVQTNRPLQAARIECESRFCQVRLFVAGTSSVAYAFRRNMSPN